MEEKSAQMETFPTVCRVILNYNDAQISLNYVDSVLKIDDPNFRLFPVN